MISYSLMAWCLTIAGGYLLLLSLLWQWLERLLNITRGIPENLLESMGLGWFVVNFLTELLFFVAIPTLAYSFFYVVLPFDGIRGALAVALLVFILGAVPTIMGLTMRLKLSMPYLLFYLMGFLLKLAGSLFIIGYIYIL
ncbi:MAG: hypothetical protein DRP47_10650 [Candidatus Zixiibacteriota bacterium]|nr:MAG: hypothetical protein DRP47_10650 [candidate division Zixibacteria bacterium]